MLQIKCCVCGHTVGWRNDEDGISHGLCNSCYANIILSEIKILDKNAVDYIQKVLEIIEKAKEIMSKEN